MASHDFVNSSTNNPDMNQSNYSEEQPLVPSNVCCVYFQDCEISEAHRKNDHLKRSEPPQPSTVPSDAITNTSETSTETQVELLADDFTAMTLSCMDILELKMVGKRTAFEAFVKAYNELQLASTAYKKVVQEQKEKFKAYYETVDREKSSNANSEEEQLVNLYRRAQMLSSAEAVLKEEEDAGMRIQQALSKQRAASETVSRSIIEARTALIEAEQSRERRKEQSSALTLQTPPEDPSSVETALLRSKIELETYDNMKSVYEFSVDNITEAVLMMQQHAANENAVFLLKRNNENSVDSMHDSQQERPIPDCSQTGQMMDSSTSASDGSVRTSNFETHLNSMLHFYAQLREPID